MLLPISDDDRSLPGPAYVTLVLIGINLAVFFLLQQAGFNPAFTYAYSVIPFEIVNGVDLVAPQTLRVAGETIQIPQAPGPTPIYLTILTAMFMHGGFAHLFGNLLYLWIFGDNVEHRFGVRRFIVFYLGSGLVATFVQIVLDPASVIPNLGASGAISGVMGAYLVLFPRNRVHALFFYVVVSIPAVAALGLWIVMQFFGGFSALASEGVGGVAYGAHIGGFITGVVFGLIERMRMREEPAHRYDPFSARDGSKRYW
ncbi:MAG: rhomboid family intramembrane serine protease [Bacteroidota bacterium]